MSDEQEDDARRKRLLGIFVGTAATLAVLLFLARWVLMDLARSYK